ncbi:MAG: hypothetical protein P8Y44_13505 [Acidobacteriota bacterium]
MRQDDGLQLRRFEEKLAPIQLLELLRSLVETAIDQDLGIAEF